MRKGGLHLEPEALARMRSAAGYDLARGEAGGVLRGSGEATRSCSDCCAQSRGETAMGTAISFVCGVVVGFAIGLVLIAVEVL